VGHVGKARKTAIAEVTQQPLSEDDYLTLADRHADLARSVMEGCRALVDAEDYETLEVLAAKLEELRACDMSVLPQAGGPDAVKARVLTAAQYVQELGFDAEDEEEVQADLDSAREAWVRVLGSATTQYDIPVRQKGAVDGEGEDDAVLSQLMTVLGTTYSGEEHGVALEKVAGGSALSLEAFTDWYVRWLYQNEDSDEDDCISSSGEEEGGGGGKGKPAVAAKAAATAGKAGPRAGSLWGVFSFGASTAGTTGCPTGTTPASGGFTFGGAATPTTTISAAPVVGGFSFHPTSTATAGTATGLSFGALAKTVDTSAATKTAAATASAPGASTTSAGTNLTLLDTATASGNDDRSPPTPVSASGEQEEWANDPVYVPPVPGTSQDTAALSCDTAEAEWANDPVYVPPATLA
jgi:hypothetical protein